MRIDGGVCENVTLACRWKSAPARLPFFVNNRRQQDCGPSLDIHSASSSAISRLLPAPRNSRDHCWDFVICVAQRQSGLKYSQPSVTSTGRVRTESAARISTNRSFETLILLCLATNDNKCEPKIQEIAESKYPLTNFNHNKFCSSRLKQCFIVWARRINWSRTRRSSTSMYIKTRSTHQDTRMMAMALWDNSVLACLIVRVIRNALKASRTYREWFKLVRY